MPGLGSRFVSILSLLTAECRFFSPKLRNIAFVGYRFGADRFTRYMFCPRRRGDKRVIPAYRRNALKVL